MTRDQKGPQHYWALMSDGTIHPLGRLSSYEEAIKAAGPKVIWIADRAAGHQWRQALNTWVSIKPKAQASLPGLDVIPNPLLKPGGLFIRTPEAFQSTLPPLWRVYIRGIGHASPILHHSATSHEARCAVQASRPQAKRNNEEYLCLQMQPGEKLEKFRISYDAPAHAQGQQAVIEAHHQAEARTIARWVFLIPNSLNITVILED